MINNINSELIKELRRRTSISIIKCKQALIEADGDIELAINNMKKSGLKIDSNKFGKLTSAGLIAIEIASDKKIGLMIEINCETDFVARNDIFRKFAKTISITALHESINNINILKTRFEAQRLFLINKVGENINIRRFFVLSGDFLSYYIHGIKIGVMVSASSNNIQPNIVKHIAMHIAARNPKYICVNDISEDVMIRERHIQMSIAMKSGKSGKILEKIVEGRINKFMSDIVLTKQEFIMDVNRTVGSVLDEYRIRIDNFIRFEIGDEI